MDQQQLKEILLEQQAEARAWFDFEMPVEREKNKEYSEVLDSKLGSEDQENLFYQSML
jgi:hypothetical protein